MQGTGVCVARAPYGARLPPLPAGESRDLPAAVASLRPRIASATNPGAAPVRPERRPHPPAQIPPSAEPRHLVVCRIRSGPVPAGDSFQYQGCQASTIPSRACPDTSSLMSSTQLRRACLPVRVVCAAARREAGQSELPRDFVLTFVRSFGCPLSWACALEPRGRTSGRKEALNAMTDHHKLG